MLVVLGHSTSAGSDSLSYATSVIKISPESLQLSCTHGSGGTKEYPRTTDPINDADFTIPNHPDRL